MVDTEVQVRELRQIIEHYQLDDHEFTAPDGWHKLDAQRVVSVVYRQPFTKNASSMGKTVRVGAETLAMLRRRKLAAAPGQTFVIPSKAGGELGAHGQVVGVSTAHT
ncbi:hypothetical protein [Nocardia stercoris]|uniref:Uncharacterized protein n=1 Tax=Nocardia stercoris TaxID=2483361 RepID=A0A3M2L8V4_9NOCA|nr:hypothetical protein [Nocardia stercoris]RMI32365.1 hypothetical protein EBN03_15480 [Nocardia stercoris]